MTFSSPPPLRTWLTHCGWPNVGVAPSDTHIWGKIWSTSLILSVINFNQSFCSQPPSKPEKFLKPNQVLTETLQRNLDVGDQPNSSASEKTRFPPAGCLQPLYLSWEPLEKGGKIDLVFGALRNLCQLLPNPRQRSRQGSRNTTAALRWEVSLPAARFAPHKPGRVDDSAPCINYLPQGVFKV